jgi:hypothetical protein
VVVERNIRSVVGAKKSLMKGVVFVLEELKKDIEEAGNRLEKLRVSL